VLQQHHSTAEARLRPQQSRVHSVSQRPWNHETCSLHVHAGSGVAASIFAGSLRFEMQPAPQHPVLKEALQALHVQGATPQLVEGCSRCSHVHLLLW